MDDKRTNEGFKRIFMCVFTGCENGLIFDHVCVYRLSVSRKVNGRKT